MVVRVPRQLARRMDNKFGAARCTRAASVADSKANGLAVGALGLNLFPPASMHDALALQLSAWCGVCLISGFPQAKVALRAHLLSLTSRTDGLSTNSHFAY